MTYIALNEQQQYIAIVAKNKYGKWEIVWPTRGYSREPIANVKAAKEWITQLMHGKQVTWIATKGTVYTGDTKNPLTPPAQL